MGRKYDAPFFGALRAGPINLLERALEHRETIRSVEPGRRAAAAMSATLEEETIGAGVRRARMAHACWSPCPTEKSPINPLRSNSLSIDCYSGVARGPVSLSGAWRARSAGGEGCYLHVTKLPYSASFAQSGKDRPLSASW